jgi:host factor-I protein
LAALDDYSLCPSKGLIFGWKTLHTIRILFYDTLNLPDGTSPRTKKAHTAMAETKQNLQDAFLNHVRKTKVPVTIFLINGVKLQGVITWFDNFCVLLRRDGQSQLVYKHAISTVMPAQPINLYDGEE